ncbi:AI-2E family transporter [Luteipulveratus flavus]|uniref:AI-2E family transporter n=1 Tax=Luteipulveratus flavus TaxID=3031728 RepID=A0ABT6C2D9_9MICO|nr:AI-2E family transporter [Luteipulveratus sp. YIM 133296]MDF8262693.1 AI-2E family transporter [Luteipulveratus sp. YIM 133296]
MSPDPARPALPRGALVLLTAAAAVVVAAGVHAARSILGPAFLALVLTIVTHPLRTRLIRRWPGWTASVVSLVVVLVVVLGFALSIVVAVSRLGSLLQEYESDFNSAVTHAADRLRDAGAGDAQVQKVSSSFDLSHLGGFIGSLLTGVAGTASRLAFALALCLFMTLDSGPFSEQLRTVARIRPQLARALTGFAHGTRHYLMVSTVFGLVVAVLDTVALQLLDVPAPLLWGLLAFLTNYIPNVGFVIGLVPPAVLALLDGGLGRMLAVVVIYCVLNLIIQSGIQNKVVGDAVGLSPTLTFVSLAFWSWLIGPVGAVLAVPLSLLVRALLVDADPESRWLASLIANRAGAEPLSSSPHTRTGDPP